MYNLGLRGGAAFFVINYHEGKGDKLTDQNSYDLHTVCFAIGDYVEKIRYNHIVEQVVSQSHPKGTCHFIQDGPLYTHNAGQDNISDSHYQQITDGGVAFDKIPHGHDPMPDAEQQGAEKYIAGEAQFIRKQAGEKTPENAFFHPNIDQVETDTKDNETETALFNSLSVQGKTAGINGKLNISVHKVEQDALCKVSDRKAGGAKGKTLKNILYHLGFCETDAAPGKFRQYKNGGQNKNTENLMDKVFCQNGFVCSNPKVFCDSCKAADEKNKRTA